MELENSLGAPPHDLQHDEEKGELSSHQAFAQLKVRPKSQLKLAQQAAAIHSKTALSKKPSKKVVSHTHHNIVNWQERQAKNTKNLMEKVKLRKSASKSQRLAS